MKLTNKHNLPEVLVSAIENDPYTKGDADISVTQLIDSSQVRFLRQKHPDREADVSDMVWAFFGQSVHAMLERIPESEGMLREQRVSTKIDDKVLSGAIDLIYTKKIPVVTQRVLADYKVTSVWSVIYGKPEWNRQLNVYRWLWEKEGGSPIDSLQIITFLRDWQKSKAGDNYPVAPICTVDIPMWDMDKTEQYVRNRLKRHFSDFPSCTDQEMWKKEDTWALMKKGRKSAVKLFKSEKEIQDAYNQYGGPDNFIQHRKGRFTRCEDYCDVSQWCKQFSNHMEQG